MLKNARVPTIGFAAFSGTGKTTLLLKLLPKLRAQGLRVGMIKHAHHSFEIDQSGKDSYELRKAGAEKILVASRHRWAMMVETPNQDEPQLDRLLENFPQELLDLLLVEGFRHVAFPKVELHRPVLKHPFLFPNDPSIMAIASDAALKQPAPLPILNLNDMDEILSFILQWLSEQRTAAI
jgi:molybdopterin-guanine dinucleotide biosynthesis adapter protein